MTKPTDAIKSKANLWFPAAPKGAARTFLVLAAAAGQQLSKWSMDTFDDTLAGPPLQIALEPQGEGSYCLT